MLIKLWYDFSQAIRYCKFPYVIEEGMPSRQTYKKERIIMTMKKLLLATMTVATGFSILTNTAQAATVTASWSARSAAQIQAALQKDAQGNLTYTVQWGDTLYALSQATGVSVDVLAYLNDVEDVHLIEAGTVFHLNADKTEVTVEKNNEVHQYSVAQATPAAIVEEKQEEPIAQLVTTPVSTPTSTKLYSLSQFMFSGVVNWNGMRFTYYSQSVLPGTGLNIPGRHVNEDGYVADADGYIVLASSQPLGTVIDTPFGYQGKVYDRGTSGNHYDVYIR